MKISFVFDTEKDDARSVIKMLENFIEGSSGSESPIIKELTTITTKREDRRMKVSYEDAENIRDMYARGVKQTDIAKKYNISNQYVSLITRNKCRIHY